jgi:hypothetical protein
MAVIWKAPICLPKRSEFSLGSCLVLHITALSRTRRICRSYVVMSTGLKYSKSTSSIVSIMLSTENASSINLPKKDCPSSGWHHYVPVLPFLHPPTSNIFTYSQKIEIRTESKMEMANPPLHQSKDGQAMSDRVKKRPRQSGFESQSDKNELSYVEFYSGIGGWTMALEEAIKRLSKEDVLVNHHRTRRIAALDHSDLCTRVFKHNFGTDKKSFQIERLTKKQVEKWQARMWFMSPPCRKYFHG